MSGLFGRSIILGSFLPAAVFVLLGWFFIGPLIPPDVGIAQQARALDPTWQAIVIIILSVVITGVLYNLNTLIVRLYEGYPWQHTSFGLLQRCRNQFQATTARAKGIRALEFKRNTMLGYRLEMETNRKLNAEWNRNLRILRGEFPKDLDAVLPTHFGNRMRASETYPEREYGIDAITMWPRLIAVIDSNYATALDNAYTSLNFMLNTSLLSAVMTLLILTIGLIYPIPLTTPRFWVPWVLAINVFAVLAYLFYLWAIDRAGAWGHLVESAFDLYRWKLLEQLGYTQRPDTKQAEYQLWQKISAQIFWAYGPEESSVNYRDDV